MKTFLFLLLSAFTANLSLAQVQFGLKGSLNLATVRDINLDYSRARSGWNAGALAEVTVQPNIFLRPEVQYSSKGFGFSAYQNASAGSVRLNYINVPILFGYRFLNHTSIMAGPEFGFLQKAVSKSQGITTDMTGFYRRFDAGVDLGLAYTINKSVGFDVRYNYGFKDLQNMIITDSNGNFIGQGKAGANSVLQLGLFFFL